MKINEFYGDSKYASLLAKYLDSDKINEIFKKSVADLASNECFIPVLGTQGSGKSSFLNAVLFGDIVLPVDADETTCIPTVVKYGDSIAPSACVVMNDGARNNVECSESGLADYVHQEKNPANSKGVAFIEITVKNDLLKNGIVFVDLPGVGSITAENQKTTLEYLKQCTAAIFMLRTCPPITESESVFIMGSLPLMGRVFWVQNRWVDESAHDAEEGRQENLVRLHNIAGRIRYPESGIYQPDVICVKRALDARIKNDVEMLSSSGIEAFRDKVIQFAADWRRNVLDGKKLQAAELLTSAVSAAEKKIEQLSGDAETQRAKIAEEKQKVDEIISENKRLGREARDFLLERKSALNALIETECQKCVENLRNGVREAIDAGLVGGEKLNSAFNDYKNRGNEEVFNAIQPAFIDVTTQLGQMLEGWKDLSGEINSDDQAKISKSQAFSDKTKVHEFYKVGGAVAGIGAGLGVVTLCASNPAGWVVAGAILIGSLFGAFCGSKAREEHLRTQQESARTELYKASEHFAAKLENDYKGIYEQFSASLDRQIREWTRLQQDSADERFRKALSDLERPLAEKESAVKDAKADICVFKKVLSEMEIG